MRLRRARTDECEDLSRIARQAKAHWGYAAEDLAAWQADLTLSRESVLALPTFVAELDGQIAGFFQIAFASGAADLDHLWVRPDHMRRGIGRVLLEKAAAEAAAAGYPELQIDSDPNAEAFYISCGAVRTGAESAPITGQPERVRPQLVLAAQRVSR